MIETHSIGQEIKNFTAHLESMLNTLPIFMIIASTLAKKTAEDIDKYIQKNSERKNSDEEEIFSMNARFYKGFKSRTFLYKNFSIATRLVPSSFLVSMVCQYDAYLGRLLKTIFLSRPELFDYSEKSYKVSEICEYGSIDDFKKYVIEKEIESILRESHSEHFNIMEKRFDVQLRKDLDIWSYFIELTQRRHLLVHNDGKVSKQYLQECGKAKVRDINSITLDATLDIDQQYFEQSYRCLYEIGVKLGQVLWRKLYPNDTEKADSNFNSVTYDLIDRGEYELACKLLDSALSMWDKKFANEQNKLIATINCAQAYKWFGDDDKCKKILDKIDWSAKSLNFKLAHHVLLDEWDNAVAVMNKIGLSGEVEKHAYKDWPLFREFRKTQQFLEAFQTIFNVDFKEYKNSKKEKDFSFDNNDLDKV